MISMVLAAMDQQTMTQSMQPFRETLASERRRLRDRSRRDGSGSARDRTVSGASHRTISPWAQWVRESSRIMWAWIVQWYWHVATRAGMGMAPWRLQRREGSYPHAV